MKFLAGVLVFVIVAAFITNYSEAADDFQCTDGVPYQENNCNGCFCRKGELACTLMACRTHLDPKFRDCEVGTTWTKDCNQCSCVERMGTVCTAKQC